MAGNLTISNQAGTVVQTPRPGTTLVQQTTPSASTATVNGAQQLTPGGGTPIIVDWANIQGKPAFGTASLRDAPPTGNAAPAQVVLGTDSRLSDARTPVYHTHVLADITDMTTFSRLLAQSVDANAAKTLLGIPSFSSPLAIAQGGTGATTLAGAQSNLVIPNSTSPLALASGGTGSGVLATAQANLGIPNNTNPLAITSGGSGANTLGGAQTNLGIPNNTAPLPVASGGSGSSTLAGAQANLQIPTTSAPLPVNKGGTASTTDTAARAALFVPYQISLTSAVRISAGTTAQRNASPQAGDFRLNLDLLRAEMYNGALWSGLGGATGGGSDAVFYLNDSVVTTSYTIPTNQNAGSFGPITINAGAVVTVNAGSVWTVV